jgi:uncharacterized protein DUF4270
VKSRILVVLIGSIFFSSFFFFLSCKKVNEATQLGDDLVPAVDNVHTFEVALNTVTNNVLFNDTTVVGYYDYIALGDLNDPEFGHTHANTCFTISPSAFGSYPFVKEDSLAIDSVVLSLAYQAAYGDTVSNGIQTLRVYEIDPNTGFNDSTFYKFADPATDFATTGGELGSATFAIKDIEDSVRLIRGTDTSFVKNVVRIRLNNSLGDKLASYDTTNGYKNDSLFKTLFAGFSIKADPTGNALSYFNLANVASTKLTVYYRYGKSDTASFDYFHYGGLAGGQSNYIERENGGNYLTYLNDGAGDQVYLQSAPGSYVKIKIPALDNFGNKTVHLAELVAVKIPSIPDNIFTAPDQLMLDRKNSNTPDTVFMLEKDLLIDASGAASFSTFGGRLRPDNTVRFDITRYVQGVITRNEPNDTLRIYAPLRTKVFNSSLHTFVPMGINSEIAKGRLVLGGGSYGDSTMRLRLRIVYSDL